MEPVYLNENGDFRLDNPCGTAGLYFPLVNEAGMMSSITPDLGGDCKHDQNTYLLPPSSKATLQNDKSTRNFWICAENKRPWSVSGRSAWQQLYLFEDNLEETHYIEAGLLWHKLTRENPSMGLRAEVLSFVPARDELIEIMSVRITNISLDEIRYRAVSAIPMYGRSADNIRDHRHVTSLLNRIQTHEYGVTLTPSLTFDERGHQINKITYGVYASCGDGKAPSDFCPVQDEFIGEGGSLEWPCAVVKNAEWIKAGESKEGFETIGAIRFEESVLAPGQSETFTVLLTIGKPNLDYLRAGEVCKALDETKCYWQNQIATTFHTGDPNFNIWMRWVSIQPVLRRIFGCSFLPHHDYGRGGRGWRDLWQDSLALLLQSPESEREKMCAYFEGVRMDGSNATIIGLNPGEFLADRNHIVRVWMDHGVWPLRTMALYADQTGDLSFLLEKRCYFKDSQSARGDSTDPDWIAEDGTRLRTRDGSYYYGTVLEHILVQNITSFYDVGEHNHMRLRGADWNDGLDMARERGESVAFTAAYAAGFTLLSRLLRQLAAGGTATVAVAKELGPLIDANEGVYGSWTDKQAMLARYCGGVRRMVSGATINYDVLKLADRIDRMAAWINSNLQSEWITDPDGGGWMNSYYDNHGERLASKNPDNIQMILTGQVFAILSGMASDSQVDDIISSSTRYLFDEHRGGYFLNTNFHEVKLNMGRAFGFAYGHKENGSVFCHIAAMLAYALYERNHNQGAWKAIEAMYRQSLNFEVSRMYPGIPEYFDINGRGMYPYLTGSASWIVSTVQTKMFGVRGDEGNLLIDPRLLPEQYDENCEARMNTVFAGIPLEIIIQNPSKSVNAAVASVTLNGERIEGSVIPRSKLTVLDKSLRHTIIVRIS